MSLPGPGALVYGGGLLYGSMFDREGRTITLERYAELMEDRDYRIVEKTQLGEVEVSTVWLGIAHPPGRAIFETMIFGGPRDQQQWRYPSEQEARRGHRRAVGIAVRASRESI